MGYYFFHLSGNQTNSIYVSQELIHILGTALFFPALLLLSFSIYISPNPPCFAFWVQIILVLGCRRSWEHVYTFVADIPLCWGKLILGRGDISPRYRCPVEVKLKQLVQTLSLCIVLAANLNFFLDYL
jgi:hypothetical protein